MTAGPADPASVYDELFVPALFEQWAGRVTEAAGVRLGHRVLDVACGTGVLARAAASRVGPDGTVVGVDISEPMLAVAARRAPEIKWLHASAESMPLEPDSFDAVVSQFGLMFFSDRAGALVEMTRVLRPGGTLAVAVWDSLSNVPGYRALTDLVEQTLGRDVAEDLRAPFALGVSSVLTPLFHTAGIESARVETHQGRAHFPDLATWLEADVRGWLAMHSEIDEDRYAQLRERAGPALRRFVKPDGSVSFPIAAQLVTATK